MMLPDQDWLWIYEPSQPTISGNFRWWCEHCNNFFDWPHVNHPKENESE